MTKTENRAAARAYAAEKQRLFQEEQEQAERASDLEAARVIRHYLIYKAKTRGGGRLDTWAGWVGAGADRLGEARRLG
jgi:hypothetical protein